MFTSPTLQVEEEVEAYPFSSFVADYGGLLGLFVGYNFLSTLDLITEIKQFCSSKNFSWK